MIFNFEKPTIKIIAKENSPPNISEYQMAFSVDGTNFYAIWNEIQNEIKIYSDGFNFVKSIEYPQHKLEEFTVSSLIIKAFLNSFYSNSEK